MIGLGRQPLKGPQQFLTPCVKALGFFRFLIRNGIYRRDRGSLLRLGTKKTCDFPLTGPFSPLLNPLRPLSLLSPPSPSLLSSLPLSSLPSRTSPSHPRVQLALALLAYQLSSQGPLLLAAGPPGVNGIPREHIITLEAHHSLTTYFL